MLARTPIQSRFSVQNTRPLFAVSIVAALTVLSLTIGLEISAAAARSPIETLELTGPSTAATVNRARKGDRLISRTAVQPNRNMHRPEPRAPAANSKLAAGCEPSVSSLARTEWSKIATRCVS